MCRVFWLRERNPMNESDDPATSRSLDVVITWRDGEELFGALFDDSWRTEMPGASAVPYPLLYRLASSWQSDFSTAEQVELLREVNAAETELLGDEAVLRALRAIRNAVNEAGQAGKVLEAASDFRDESVLGAVKRPRPR